MSKKKHLVFLTPFYDLPSPRSIRVQNIVKYLKEDYHISVVCFHTTSQLDPPVDINVVRLKFSWLNYFITNKTYSGYKPSGAVNFFSRAMSYVFNRFFIFPDPWILEAKKIINAVCSLDQKPDIIIASMLPFSMGEIALKTSQLLSSEPKVIFDIGDPFANNAARQRVNNIARKLSYEKSLVSSADHLVLTNVPTAKYYEKEHGVSSENTSVVQQGVNLNLISTESKSLTPGNPLKLIYAGAFYPELRNPNMFFSAIEKIDDMIKVQVYGNVLDMFKLNNEHVLFEGRVDQKALAKAYEGSDALLFIDNKFGLQTSGKIFELLAFKKPIIFLYNNEESLVYTYAKHFSNIFFIRNEESELRDQVMRLKDFIIKDHKYDYDVNQFSWDGRATQFKSIVKSLN